jgi:hypothetical protein
MTIIDSVTTISEVCALQAHNMNALVAADGTTRVFSDTQIEATINNVIRFVYANSDKDLEENAKIFAINTISAMGLNNVMCEAGYLPDWTIIDIFDKEVLNKMIQTKKESNDSVDVVPFYRTMSHLYGGY